MFYLFFLWLVGNVAAWLSVAMTLHPADSKKSKSIYWTGCVATSLLTLGILYAQYCDDKVDRMWSEAVQIHKDHAEKRWQNEVASLQKQNLIKSDEIKALMGDEEAMKRSIANKNELLNQLLTREMEPAIEEHYKTLQLQLRTRSESMDVDKKVFARYEKRMDAIFSLFLTGYTRWMQKARLEGQALSEPSTTNFSPIQIGHRPSYREVTRTSLANGNSIWIEARPATVANGILTGPLHLLLNYQQPSGGVQIISLVVSDSSYAVNNVEKGKLTFLDYSKESSDPADEDKEFLERIVVATNQAMGYVIREVEATKPAVAPANVTK